MTDYKLVPIGPTPEMVEAAEDAYMPFGDMELAVRMALLAAPAVQGEVGEGVPDYINDAIDNLYHDNYELSHGGYLERTRDVELIRAYIARTGQPAEQQPISHDWDDQDKCRRCGDRDWYASATCTPKKQPAPDVAQLVEALESAKNLIANHSGEVLPDEYAGDQIEQIDAALAAHRKGGE